MYSEKCSRSRRGCLPPSKVKRCPTNQGQRGGIKLFQGKQISSNEMFDDAFNDDACGNISKSFNISEMNNTYNCCSSDKKFPLSEDFLKSKDLYLCDLRTEKYRKFPGFEKKYVPNETYAQSGNDCRNDCSVWDEKSCRSNNDEFFGRFYDKKCTVCDQQNQNMCNQSIEPKTQNPQMLRKKSVESNQSYEETDDAYSDEEYGNNDLERVESNQRIVITQNYSNFQNNITKSNHPGSNDKTDTATARNYYQIIHLNLPKSKEIVDSHNRRSVNANNDDNTIYDSSDSEDSYPNYSYSNFDGNSAYRMGAGASSSNESFPCDNEMDKLMKEEMMNLEDKICNYFNKCSIKNKGNNTANSAQGCRVKEDNQCKLKKSNCPFKIETLEKKSNFTEYALNTEKNNSKNGITLQELESNNPIPLITTPSEIMLSSMEEPSLESANRIANTIPTKNLEVNESSTTANSSQNNLVKETSKSMQDKLKATLKKKMIFNDVPKHMKKRYFSSMTNMTKSNTKPDPVKDKRYSFEQVWPPKLVKEIDSDLEACLKLTEVSKQIAPLTNKKPMLEMRRESYPKIKKIENYKLCEPDINNFIKSFMSSNSLDTHQSCKPIKSANSEPIISHTVEADVMVISESNITKTRASKKSIKVNKNQFTIVSMKHMNQKKNAELNMIKIDGLYVNKISKDLNNRTLNGLQEPHSELCPSLPERKVKPQRYHSHSHMSEYFPKVRPKFHSLNIRSHLSLIKETR